MLMACLASPFLSSFLASLFCFKSFCPLPPHLLFAMHNIACIVSNSVAWCSWHVCMWCTVCHQYAGRLLCGGTLHSAPASSRCSGLHLRQLRQPHPGKLHLQKPSTHYCKLLPLGGFVCLTAPCCVTGGSHMWARPVCLISCQDHARVELTGFHVLDVPHCCSCFQRWRVFVKVEVQGKVRKQLTQFCRRPAPVGAQYVNSAAFLWQCTVCSGIQTVVLCDALFAFTAMLQ